jgi:hypothetical protein
VTGDSTPTCNAALDNAVTTSILTLTTPMPNGAFVETTLMSVGTSTTRNQDFQDVAGNTASAPQSRQATATAPETTKPQVVSAQGAVGSTTITLTFSEPIYCSAGWTYDAADISITDGNASTTDPIAAGAGTNVCGGTPTTADTSFSFTTNIALPADRTYTITLTPDLSTEIRDIVGNPLGDSSGTACSTPVTTCTVTFTTGAGDFTPPTMVDARMANNLTTTDFADIGDSFTLTFSEAMNGVTTGNIGIQDQDGTTATITCSAAAGANQASCTWNTAVTTLTVTLTGALGVIDAGTTPNMQIPFNITTLTQVQDLQGNPPNVLGSADRLVDFE